MRDRDVTLRFLAQPTDVNYGGKVHGGAVMKWIDQAGYAAAVAWSGHYCVTVAVGGMRFVSPIRISDLVTVHARLVQTGTSSMQFLVEVQARDPRAAGGAEDDRLCTHCVITFVALDAPEGRPVSVPAWTPASDEDKRLADYAGQVMALGRDLAPAPER